MAGSEEKSEKATPRSLRKARERGEVAQSRDLTSAIVLAGAMSALLFGLDGLIDNFRISVIRVGERIVGGPLNAVDLIEELAQAMRGALMDTLLIMVAAALMGGLMSFLQIGPLLTFTTLNPKLERLDPIAGFKRVFFSSKSYIELIRSFVKFFAAALVCRAVIVARLPDILRTADADISTSTKLMASTVSDLAVYILLLFASIGIVDLFYQRWQFARDHRMTKKEQKDERKEAEGDPKAKAARKRLQRQLLEKTMFDRMATKVDCAVKNPTHLVVGLRYDVHSDAFVMVAKGDGPAALRLLEIAEEERIPVREDVPLARALYAIGIDEAIPREFEEAVIVVFKWAADRLRAEGRELSSLEEADPEI